MATMLLAQIPNGYYNAASGKSGQELKTALFKIIGPHTDVGYGGLFTVYQKSDLRPDGKIWDMYSGTTNYSIDDHNGSYSKEGDMYNREHSVPQSWFQKASPMKSDAFHVVPTDGYVNNRRENFPFGNVSAPTYTSNGGFSKVGRCANPGYSGTAFEPNDEYKGDFARIYFYMATCYENRIGSWGGVFGKGTYPGMAQWELDVLLKWAKEDPVSKKEIDRNNAVYKFQHNRNPYVDFPGLEQYVWGEKKDTNFDPANYNGSTTPSEADAPAAPVFSLGSGEVAANTVVTISIPTAGSTLVYTINGGSEQTATSTVTLTISQATTISAYTTKDGHKSDIITRSWTIESIAPQPTGENLWVRVNSASQLKAGSRYLIVCEGESRAMSAQSSTDYRTETNISIVDGTIQTEVNASGKPYAFKLGGQNNAWTLFDEVGNVYLSLEVDKNKINTNQSATATSAQWTITLTGGDTRIANVANNRREIRYNSSASRFSTYTQGQHPITLYVESPTTGVNTMSLNTNSVNVYDTTGRLILRNVNPTQTNFNLPAGIYIIGGRKIIVR